MGLHVTRQRTTVLSAVATHPHADTQSIIDIRPSLGPGSVPPSGLRRAARLTAAGLLRCIEPAGSVARYETRTGDNHHHLICRTCGAIVDVDCAVGAAPCLTPAQDHGYSIDQAEVSTRPLPHPCVPADS